MEAPRLENTPPFPWSTSKESDALRRSSRLGSYAQKRQYDDLKGLTTPQKKKKRKLARDRNHDVTLAQKAWGAEQQALEATPQSSRTASAPAAAESATVPPPADTDEVSNPGQADANTGEERLSQEETDQILERRYTRQQQQMLEQRRCHSTRLLASEPRQGYDTEQ